MTANRFRQVRHLFEAVLEHPEADRGAFLEEASQGDLELKQEVQRLLANAESTGVLDRPAVATMPAQDRWEGRRLGPYEILRELGRGGMGTVYLAIRADQAFERRVAVKVVRPDVNPEEVLRRFQRERQILAALDHPHIARLLDAGTTPEGLPYFVMEYVDGQPIDRYCDEHGLDVASRLRLFGDVCEAVEYAHRQRIVHRDLKPGNILVTSGGNVKLLDFGIARLLAPGLNEPVEAVTRTEFRLMTPEYASPEQVRGESVGYASDVYSLGVVLYQLLTGTLPYSLKSRILHEVVRVICEEEPTRPSVAVTRSPSPELLSTRHATPEELRSALSGDLDSILLKALAKESDHRYATPNALRQDLDRHACGEKVTARSGAIWRPALRFLQKHSLPVAAAGVFLTGVLGGWIRLDPKLTEMISLMVGSMLLGGWAAKRFGLVPITTQALARRMAYLVLITVSFSLLLVGLARGRAEALLTTILLSTSAWVFWFLLRWIFRERFAGRLLVDPTPGNRNFIRIIGVIVLLSAAIYAAQMISAREFAWNRLALALNQAFLGLYNLFLSQRTEFRTQGIISGGAYIRWRQIRGYHWTGERKGAEFLQLKASAMVPWYRSIMIPVASAAKDEVENLLESRFAEWPDA